MISVQNRLQPSSGNKYFSLLLLPLLLLSCGAFKKTQTTPWPEDDVIVTHPSDDKNEEDKKDVVIKETTPKEENVALTYAMVSFKGEEYRVPVHKKNFKIAVMLPFHLQGAQSKIDKLRANIVLEYYQGMLLAISKIENLESKFDVHFYDTDNDTNTLRKILRKPELEDVDLIIGPTDDAQVRIAAYFAKVRKIPLISPITTMDYIKSDNPNVFFLNPSDKMKAKKFLTYYLREHKGEKLVLVRDGKSFDKTFGEALIHLCEAQELPITEVAYSNYIRWAKQIGGGQAVIVHTGQSKSQMSYSVTGLQSQAGNVTLVVSDRWMNFHNVDYKQLGKLNVTYISTEKSIMPNTMAQSMYRSYTRKYKGTPSSYTYMGYDQFLFACESLDAFGKYFPMYLEGKTISYANTDFSLTKTPSVFQNNYLMLYRFEDHKIIPIEF